MKSTTLLQEKCRERFEQYLATLPKPMQKTIRESMDRHESNSWKFWQVAWAACIDEVRGKDETHSL